MSSGIKNWKRDNEIVKYVNYAVEKFNLNKVVAVYEDREEVKEDLAKEYNLDAYEDDDKLDELFEKLVTNGKYFEENYQGAVLKLED